MSHLIGLLFVCLVAGALSEREPLVNVTGEVPEREPLVNVTGELPEQEPSVNVTEELPEREPSVNPLPRNATTDGPVPGLKTRVTQKGLDYLVPFRTHKLMLQLPQQRIPDVEESIGPLNTNLTNIRIKWCDQPVSEIVLVPDGLFLNATQIKPVIDADYTAIINTGFSEIRKSGTVRITGHDMSFHLEFQMGNDAEGQPAMKVSNCDSDGRASFNFSGDWSESLNNRTQSIHSKLQDLLLAELCATAVEQIEQQAAMKIRKFIDAAVLHQEDFVLDFSFVGNPVFYEDALETSHLGGFFHVEAGERQMPPFEPPPIPVFPEHVDRMGYFYFTDYSINTFLYAAYISDKMGYYLTSDSLPAEYSHYLATSCSGLSLCVGSFIPQLSQLYPTGEVALSIYATSAPTVEFREGKVVATAAANADVLVRDANDTHQVITVNLNVVVHCTVHMDGHHVSFSIISFTPDVNFGASTVYEFGAMSEFVLDSMVRLITHAILLPQLTTAAETGFMLPEDPEIELRNTFVSVDPEVPGVLTWGFDVEHPPLNRVMDGEEDGCEEEGGQFEQEGEELQSHGNQTEMEHVSDEVEESDEMNFQEEESRSEELEGDEGSNSHKEEGGSEEVEGDERNNLLEEGESVEVDEEEASEQQDQKLSQE